MSEQKPAQPKPQPSPQQTIYKKPDTVYIGDSADKPLIKRKSILG